MRSIIICIVIGFLGAAFYGRADTVLQLVYSGVAGGLFLYALFGWLPARIMEQARERAQLEADYAARWDHLGQG